MFNIHFSVERWKWNADFELYVSNKGHFRTRDKKDVPVKVNSQGYCLVHCKGIVNKYRLAHRVVMLTWCPTDDAENLTIDHLDHNKRNNAVDNLEWVTQEENWRRAYSDHLTDAEQEKSEIIIKLPKTGYPVYVILEGGVAMTIEQMANMLYPTFGHSCVFNGQKVSQKTYPQFVYQAVKSNKKKICGITIEKRVKI